MFYFKDFFFRFLYSIYTYLFLFIILFFKKEIVLALININLIENFFDFNKNIFTTITYGSPVDLLLNHIYILFLCTLFIYLPYFLWLLFDFYKSSLKYSQFKLTNFILKFSFFIFILIIIIFFVLVLPLIWQFFQNTNFFLEKSSYLSFFQQLQFDKYFLFLKNFFFIIFYFYLFILILALISFKFKLNLLLNYRKFFLIINILTATLISPPDVFSQVCLFFCFIFLFEILCLFFLMLLKYKKLMVVLV